MKVKGALALVVSAALSISTLTGCSESAKNYGEELNKVSAWENYTTESEGIYTIEGQGISQTFNFTESTYYSDNKAYSEIKYSAADGNINMPDMKIYCDGTTSYINKSYFEDMFTLNGQKVPDGLKNLNAEYISLDSGLNTDQMKELTKDPKDYMKLSQSLLGDSDIDLPFVQNGREYELNLDSDKVAEFELLLSKNLIANNSSKNDKDLLSKDDKQESADELKDLYSGSSIKMKSSFSDDKYTSDIDYDIKVKDSSEVKVTSSSTSVKCDKKDITIPDNAVKLTQEEFTKLLGEETTQNNAALAKTIQETV